MLDEDFADREDATLVQVSDAGIPIDSGQLARVECVNFALGKDYLFISIFKRVEFQRQRSADGDVRVFRRADQVQVHPTQDAAIRTQLYGQIQVALDKADERDAATYSAIDDCDGVAVHRIKAELDRKEAAERDGVEECH